MVDEIRVEDSPTTPAPAGPYEVSPDSVPSGVGTNEEPSNPDSIHKLDEQPSDQTA
jgi:hypothetical protein